MDTPHVVVVEEAVASLLNEFNLMGNLIERYSAIDKVDGPVMFREKINEELNDTMKQDFTFDFEIPEDSPQDKQDVDVTNVLDAVPNQLNPDLTTAGEQINGDFNDTVQLNLTPSPSPSPVIALLHNGEQIEPIPSPVLVFVDEHVENAEIYDEDETAIDMEFAEFDPMDHLYIRPPQEDKLKDVLMLDENNERFDQAMNMSVDATPVQSPSADELRVEVENNIDEQFLNNNNDQTIKIDKELRLILSPLSNEVLMAARANNYKNGLKMNSKNKYNIRKRSIEKTLTTFPSLGSDVSSSSSSDEEYSSWSGTDNESKSELDSSSSDSVSEEFLHNSSCTRYNLRNR